MGGVVGEDVYDYVFILDYVFGLVGVCQYLQQGVYVLVVWDCIDGVDGVGIVVEQVCVYVVYQVGVIVFGFEFFDQNGFVGEWDYFQVNVVFQCYGVLFYGCLEYWFVVFGDILDVYFVVQGGVWWYLVDVYQFGDGVQLYVYWYVVGIKNICQGVDQFLVNVYFGEQLFYFLLLFL